MTNQLSTPKTSDFKGQMKAAYDAIYPLYGVLFGSDQFEIPVHFSGSLTVDNDITIGSTLNLNDWKIDGDGDDIRFRDDGLVERFRIGDNASTYAATVTGSLLVTVDTTINGQLNVKGNTTLGDAGTDTVSTSGPLTVNDSLTVTQNISASGNLTVNGTTQLGNASGDLTTVAGNLQVDNNANISGTFDVDNAFSTQSTADFNGSVHFHDDVNFNFGSTAGFTESTWGGYITCQHDGATIYIPYLSSAP